MTDLSLSIAIMAAPPRAARATRLAEKLHEQAREAVRGGFIVTSPHVSMDHAMLGCRHGASRAWALATAGTTHHLVVQDDAIPCEGFVLGVAHAISAKPDAPVSFFVDRSYRLGSAIGPAWATPRSFFGAQAIAMPVGLAGRFSRHLHENIGRYDDRMLDAFATLSGLKVHVTVPGLVQHDVNEPSLLGHPNPLRSDCVVEDARDLRWDDAPYLRGA